MKNYLIFVTILCSSCLFPGAPRNLYYKANRAHATDSLVVISYPKGVDYAYWGNMNEVDSVFIHGTYNVKRSKANAIMLRPFEPIFDQKHLIAYQWQWWNLSKLERIDCFTLRKYYNGTIKRDTFYRVMTPRVNYRK